VDGGRYFFSTVREGDQIMFATDDEAERTLWVQAVYRATGQSHKPVPPSNQPQSRQAPSQANTQLSKVQGGMCHLCARPADNTWLGSRVVIVLYSGAEGPGFKSQPRRCRVTVLGKLLTPVMPVFTKQRNWLQLS